MFLEAVADGEIPEFRGIEVPADGMAAGPVAVGGGADRERHLDAVAGIEAAAADLGELPAGAEIAGPHLGVGFEAARREDHAAPVDLGAPAVLPDLDAPNPLAVIEQLGRAAIVADLDP